MLQLLQVITDNKTTETCNAQSSIKMWKQEIRTGKKINVLYTLKFKIPESFTLQVKTERQITNYSTTRKYEQMLVGSSQLGLIQN